MAGYMPKSKSDKWATPIELYNKLNDEFHFTFDPCPITWKEGDPDGLDIEWGTCTFVNPPYSQVAKWIEKSYDEWKKGKKVVMLINSITDTKAFHKFILPYAEIRFIQGRVKFVNSNEPNKSTPNVKPSLVIVFK